MMTKRTLGIGVALVFVQGLVNLTVSASATQSASVNENDPQIQGIWRTVSYVIDGTAHDLDGLFILTERHFSANVLFDLSGGEFRDANANAGTYRTEEDRLIFIQEVQIHIRPGEDSEPLFYGAENAVESSTYRITEAEDGVDRLEIIFPSGNHYVCRRVAE